MNTIYVTNIVRKPPFVNLWKGKLSLNLAWNESGSKLSRTLMNKVVPWLQNSLWTELFWEKKKKKSLDVHCISMIMRITIDQTNPREVIFNHPVPQFPHLLNNYFHLVGLLYTLKWNNIYVQKCSARVAHKTSVNVGGVIMHSKFLISPNLNIPAESFL